MEYAGSQILHSVSHSKSGTLTLEGLPGIESSLLQLSSPAEEEQTIEFRILLRAGKIRGDMIEKEIERWCRWRSWRPR